MKLLDQIHDWAGVRINGLSINVDLVNGCCLACPSCAIGSMKTKRKGTMTFSYFCKMLDKIELSYKIRHIQLYMYSDPCLHKDLHLFVGECTKRGIKTWISTMLQTTKCDFQKVIEARPTEFRISFPGWDKMEYYQKNAKPEKFNEKFWEVIKLPRYPETVWTLIWHVYNDNQNERERVERFARMGNLKLVPLPAIFMPLEKYVDGYYTAADDQLISHLLESPEDAAKTMKRTDTCDMWKQLAIDANGDLYLCQLVYEERFHLGINVLDDMSIKEMLKKVKTHPYCGKCLSKGGNVLQACYSEMATSKDPIAEANKKRRL